MERRAARPGHRRSHTARSPGARARRPSRRPRRRDGHDRHDCRRPLCAWPIRSTWSAAAHVHVAQLRPAAVDRYPEGAVPPARFSQGVDTLKSVAPDFADAYRIVNSTSASSRTWLTPCRSRLARFEDQDHHGGVQARRRRLTRTRCSSRSLPRGPLFLINESFLKLYVEYAPTDKEGDAAGRRHRAVRIRLDGGRGRPTSGCRRSTTSAWSSTSDR